MSHTKLMTSRRSLLRVMRRMNTRGLLALLVGIFIFSGLGIIVGLQPPSALIGSHGKVKVVRVGVYKDNNCNIVVGYLDWGTFEPGSAQNITVYVRNEGNYVSTLFLEANNWNPLNASNYMSLSWNYDGRKLGPMVTVEVVLTLSVSSNVENIRDFSFEVIIGIDG